jgi:acyl-CoA thioesterase I
MRARFESARLRGAGIAVALGFAVAVSLGGCSAGAQGTAHHTQAPDVPVTASSPVVVAIGDSIMKGHGLPSSDAWPAIIAKRNGWKLTNLACNGAGFAKIGDSDDCADTFSGLIAKAATLHPTILLISGSSNDLGFDDTKLSATTLSDIKLLRSENPTAKIVGISTVWGDTLIPSQIDDINDQVRAAVDAVGGIYLDIGQPLAGHRDWLQSDDVHPTAKGQRVLARVIAGALRSAKIIG